MLGWEAFCGPRIRAQSFRVPLPLECEHHKFLSPSTSRLPARRDRMARSSWVGGSGLYFFLSYRSKKSEFYSLFSFLLVRMKLCFPSFLHEEPEIQSFCFLIFDFKNTFKNLQLHKKNLLH